LTKSKNIGRGGARPGSGPKKKPGAGPITKLPALTGNKIEDDKTLADWVRAGLVHIAASGASEAARVAALKELGDRAEGKSKPGVAQKSDQPDMFENDGWGDLLKSKQPAAGRPN
jgi:hypothetical protein